MLFHVGIELLSKQTVRLRTQLQKQQDDTETDANPSANGRSSAQYRGCGLNVEDQDVDTAVDDENRPSVKVAQEATDAEDEFDFDVSGQHQKTEESMSSTITQDSLE